MNLILNDTPIKTLDHVRPFLNGIGAIEFNIAAKAARYAWIQARLLRFHDPQLGKAEKGLLLDVLQKVSGYSRIQGKRLTQRARQTGQLPAAAHRPGVSPPLYAGGYSTLGADRRS